MDDAPQACRGNRLIAGGYRAAVDAVVAGYRQLHMPIWMSNVIRDTSCVVSRHIADEVDLARVGSEGNIRIGIDAVHFDVNRKRRTESWVPQTAHLNRDLLDT